MTDRRPRVVLVTGGPGSGKTTLAAAIARELQVPFLARDAVRRGQLMTSGAWTDDPGPRPTREASTDAFLDAVDALTGLGVSVVVEYVLRAALPEQLERLAASGDLVAVRTHAAGALARAEARDRGDRLVGHLATLAGGAAADVDPAASDRLDAAMVRSMERLRAVSAGMLVDLGDVPVLEVTTDDGWDPGIDEVLAFVTRTAR